MLRTRLSLGDRLLAALAGGPERPDLIGSDDRAGAAEAATVPAAVLIAAVDRPEPGLILTRRHEGLRTHAGQIAFPGGRVDPSDRDATAAALREAEEELALPRHLVRPLAELDPFETITGYRVVPVLAVVPADLPLVPQAGEVAEWFEVPFRAALDPANRTERAITFRGQPRRVFEIEANGRTIWGATAAMLVNLAARIGIGW